ncbi:MAG: Flp pilus assembly protein CpaB, partial [Nocardioides sp.]|nr:Flp pilus assembly protein CpaB [Nocardioides sp.]
VFIAVVGYVSNVRNQYGATRTVLKLNSDVDAFEPISPASVEKAQVPARYVSNTQLTNPDDLINKVAAAPIPAGSYLSQGMLTDKPDISTGQQEIAILIDAETGVAGQVHSGSYVDVYATYDASQTNKDSCAIRVLSNVPVISIGNLTSTSDSSGQTSSSVPVTFALSASDTLKLSAAESFAQKVRLALRKPGDHATSIGGNEACIQQITRSTK